MVDYLAGPVTHDAFFRKYASKKFLKGEQIHSHYMLSMLTPSSIHYSSFMGQEVGAKAA